jgi:Winged helix DNA-binding domain
MLEGALYERRSLVRMLGMRRTLFVVPAEIAGVMNAACTEAFVAGERRRLITMLGEQGVAHDPARWLDRVSRRTFAALESRGEASARELTADVPELATKLYFGAGKTWGGTVGVSTRVLFLLATEGRIVRSRPMGSWTSGQYRWAPIDRWLEGGLPSVPRAEACAELLRRWLRAFGPATTTDLRWWTGWTAKLAASTLAAIDAVEVGLDDGTGWVLPDDLEPVGQPDPWVALLPGLDATTMGWKERDWYLGDHRGAMFDRNGNAGPTIWADGRVVGGWTQRRSGEIVTQLLEPVGEDLEAAIDAERDRLERWLGDVRVTPRFRTPLERELSG